MPRVSRNVCKAMKKLLIVDDHCLFADGIRFLIEFSTDYEVVGVLHNGREVIPFLTQTPASILLLDIDLPDMSGFELAKAIRDSYPHTNVLALSMHSDKQSIERMMEAGAAGYCIKSAGREELFTAIQTVAMGRTYLPSAYIDQRSLRKDTGNRYTLTERETDVIQLIVEGVSTKQIASRLFLSTRTVETHRKNIYRKLGVHTNVELTVYARSNHLI